MSNFSILEAKSPPPTATAAQFVVVQYSSKIPLSLFAHSDSVSGKNKDVQLIDSVEIEFLAEQVEAIRNISEYFAQLRTLHKGHSRNP
ncbi:hypothetical protein COP2_044515 [Malus domestica]